MAETAFNEGDWETACRTRERKASERKAPGWTRGNESRKAKGEETEMRERSKECRRSVWTARVLVEQAIQGENTLTRLD